MGGSTLNNEDTYGYNKDEDEDTSLALQSLKREHAKQGYLDGVTESKEKSLQKGFDSGYPLGAQIGELIGEIVGQSCINKATGKVDNNEHRECIESLKIEKVLQSKYFDKNLSLDDPKKHELIRKWFPTK